uniref:Uncharacterized protein n=1 Tax=Graphocephala atropunctata TaxID=36148 RepID=A0A1B6LYA9_9HEMI
MIHNISGLLDHMENEDEEQYNVNDESKICRNNCEEKIVEKIQEKEPLSGGDGYLEDLTNNKSGDSDDQMEIEDTQTDDYQPNESDLEEDRDDRILENDLQLRTRKKRHQVKLEDWKINKSKTRRKLGQEYLGKKKLNDGKWKYALKKHQEK